MCTILALDFYGPTHPSFLNSLIPFHTLFAWKEIWVFYFMSPSSPPLPSPHVFFLWLSLHGNAYWFISTVTIVWSTCVTLAYQYETQQFSIFTSGTLFTSEPPSTGFIDTFGGGFEGFKRKVPLYHSSHLKARIFLAVLLCNLRPGWHPLVCVLVNRISWDCNISKETKVSQGTGSKVRKCSFPLCLF